MKWIRYRCSHHRCSIKTSGRLLLKICHKKRKMNEDDIEELIGVAKERKDRTKSKV